MKSFSATLKCSAILGFALLSTNVNANAMADERLLNLHLTVSWGKVNGEKIPFFDIKITNISHTPIRALDVRNRPDFIDSYCDVQITPLTRDFELSRSISDPNIINDTDFIELAPGQSVEFKEIILPIDYRELVPGRYKAYAIYRVDPIRRPNETYRSDDILFEVK